MPKNEPGAERENSLSPTPKKQKKQAGRHGVTKTKKLVKRALKNEELYTPAEIQYFKKWLGYKRREKTAKINKDK